MKKYLVYLFLFIVTVLLYSKTFKYEYNIDDSYIINKNLYPTQDLTTGFANIFSTRYNGVDYRPLTLCTFFLEYKLLGKISSYSSHAVNVILYALLMLVIFNTLTKIPLEEKQTRILAFIATLIFIVHPSHTEVAASIKSRDCILSMLFGMLALRHYLMAKNLSFKTSFICMLLIGIGSFAKLDAYVFMLIIPAFHIILNEQLNYKQFIKFICIMLLVTLVIGNIKNGYIPIAATSRTSIFPEENIFVNHQTLLNKISIACTSYFYYLKFMVVPVGYYFYFGYKKIGLYPIFSFINIVGLLLLAASVWTVFYYRNRQKYISLAAVFYIIGISYALNIIEIVRGVVGVRMSFIASLGWCMLLAYSILRFAEWIKGKYITQQETNGKATKKKNAQIQQAAIPFYKREIFIIGAMSLPVVFVYSLFTLDRTNDWKNSSALYTADMPYLKESYIANKMASNYYLANSYRAKTKEEHEDALLKSIQYAQNNLKIDDRSDSLSFNTIRMKENLGIAYQELGNIALSNQYYKAVLLKDSLSQASWFGLAQYYFFGKKDYDSSIIYFTNSLKLDTLDDKSMVALTKSYLFKENKAAAIRFSDSIVRRRPTSYSSYVNMAELKANLNDSIGAIDNYIEAYKYGLRADQMAYNLYHYLINEKKDTIRANKVKFYASQQLN